MNSGASKTILRIPLQILQLAPERCMIGDSHGELAPFLLPDNWSFPIEQIP